MSEIRNLHPDPRCLKERITWEGTSRANGEKWRYELKAGSNNGTVSCWANLSAQAMRGKVLYARITSATQAVIDNLSVENASTIVRSNGWIAARVHDNNTGTHSLSLVRGPFVLQEVGCYTPDDWESLYTLYQSGKIQLPWMAGPRNATAAGETGPWEL